MAQLRIVVGRLLIFLLQGKLHHAVGKGIGAFLKTKPGTLALVF
ncbi:hypothetical protein X736_33435 [Mesorhizobium sp. L2C089B000]|nr:hypothetical protein X736_33435 [Mesorhizobium sp. L2C089B000]